MITAAVVSADPAGSRALRASLQQTGLVYSVREWTGVGDGHPLPGEPVPDVVLLDLPREPEPYFGVACQLRQLRPTVRLIACSSEPPDSSLLLQAMRSGVQDFLAKPVDSTGLREVLLRFAEEQETAGGRGAEKLIVVVGAKGGVGTSTVAVNLAVQIVHVAKKKVALLDFVRPLGHIALLLDLQTRFSLRDAAENLERLDGHFLGGLMVRHKTGVEVLPGTSHAEEWQLLSAAVLTRVVNVAQSNFDFVVVDGGVQDFSGWASVVKGARAVLLVAEANLLALWTLERHLAAAAGLGVPPEKVHIVINRWRRNDDEALENVEKALKQPVYARLPNDYRQVSQAATLGMPLTGGAGNPLVARYREVAMDLAGMKDEAGERRAEFTRLLSPRR